MALLNTIKQSKVLKDLGFGNKDAQRGGRFINKDGSFNVVRKGAPFATWFSLYHYLVTITWLSFLFHIVCGYILVNLGFAVLYSWTGVEKLGGVDGETHIEKFLDAFFFSCQTFTTVGYGRINPVGITANFISAFESLTGLLSFALATGLLYGRFSRPNVSIVFSKSAIIAPYNDITAFEFMLANGRPNQLINLEIQVAMSRIEGEPGKESRRYYELELERKTLDFFPTSWTVVHPIDENSPLYGYTKEQVDKSDAEFLILLKAFDDTFAQNVHTRNSYKFNEMVWNVNFANIFTRRKDGITIMELNKLGDFKKN